MIYKCIANKCYDKDKNELNYGSTPIVDLTIGKNYEVVKVPFVPFTFSNGEYIFKVKNNFDHHLYLPYHLFYQMFKSIEEVREENIKMILK